MKRCILLLIQIVVYLVPGKNAGQSVLDSVPVLSPEGIFDVVSDRFGNRYALANLNISSAKPISGVNTISSIVGTCVAGKFTLHFEAGSIFDLSPSAQTLICQVYTDISNFINSNAAAGSVHIHCRNTSSIYNLGAASSYFVYPSLAYSPDNSLLDGQVYKALVSGTDPYLNLPLSFIGAGGFYHGYVEANDSVPWNFTPTITAIASGEFDFYSVMLHEAMHALGIVSLIDYNGLPYFGGSNSYSRYDQFLYDHNGNPLLVSSNTLCAASSYSFGPASASVIGVSMITHTAAPADTTNCSTAAQYIGSSTITVYTPDEFEPGSSLMHFEDMCTHPSGTTACTGSPADWNNLYFSMANFSSPGPCYVKRHLTDPERLVLCDLGYSVNATFGSTVVTGSLYTYTAGQCSPVLTIYGNNDGLAGNVYTYSTTGASTVIPFSSLLANDIPVSGIDISCLELISGNATLTTGSTNFTVDASVGAGIILLRYFPKDPGSGMFGNATYVTVYFIPAGCSSCNLINNGGFEFSHNAPGTFLCGVISPSLRWLDCWEPYQPAYTSLGSGEDLLTTSCPTLAGGPYQLGGNVWYMSPSPGTLNLGANANYECIGLRYTGYTLAGAMKNTLNSPLINGQTYQVSYWVINPGPTSTNTMVNTPGNPVVITVAAYPYAAFIPTVNFPTGLNVLNQSTINVGSVWTQVTYTFVYTSTLSAQSVIIGIDVLQTTPPTITSPGAFYYYCLLDEVSILPYPGVSFSVPASTLCTNEGLTDLALLTGTTPGTFSGPGVAYNSVTGKYDFNALDTLAPGVYPIGFTYSNTTFSCTNTIYHSVNVVNCCATSTIPAFTGTTVSGGSVVFNGPTRFPNSFTIQPGNQLALAGGEFLIDQGVKITVSSTATLVIAGAHLYGCVGLWQGIEVLDGGIVKTVAYNGNENLIEDAEMAMDITSYNPATTNGFVELKDIIFNKNYISIHLANYTLTSNTYSTPLSISNCVFTCRNFTFNAASWPHASTSDLRSATNATTGLAPPYSLQNYPLTTLKSPHAGVPSHIAVNILNSGSTATLYPASSIFSFNTVYIGPASGGTASANFILFDAHENFITSSGSNLRVENCVFQNTQTLTANAVGAAIQFKSSLTHNKLDVNGASSSLGCRFYNCHTAVDVKNAYSLDIENAIIRSTHSTSAPSSSTSSLLGDRGIFITTNRFEDYVIKNNEFTNITDAVDMVCAPDTFVGYSGWFEPFSGPVYWNIMYARNATISNNTFCPELNTAFSGPTTNYLNSAISIGNPLNIWFTYGNGIRIENNLLHRVYHGISLSGLNSIGIAFHNDGPPKVIGSNTITLDEDNVYFSSQKAIEFANSVPAPAGYPTYSAQTLQSIEYNALKVYGAPLTNTNIALVYGMGNGASGSVVPAPYIICNDLADGYQGFVFNGPNNPAYWKGNKMTNLNRGMSLSNNGSIGQQGKSNAPTDNVWSGSWTGNYGTYIDGSNAVLSPLYIRTGSTWAAPTPSGNVGSPFLYGAIGSTLTATGAYSCHSTASYNQMVVPLPDEDDYDSSDLLYIAKMQAYRYLYFHDSVTKSNGALQAFYEDQEGTSLEAFMALEDLLATGKLSEASDALHDMDQGDFGVVEANYYNFYNLYLKYKTASSLRPFTHSNLAQLVELAGACPGTNGIPVYQARALYTMVTGKVFNAPAPCIAAEEERAAFFPEPAVDPRNRKWDVKIFPNPASRQLNFASNTETELLEATITDLSGRLILTSRISISGFFATLDLDLVNGAYMIQIRNATHEQVNKKLLIAR